MCFVHFATAGELSAMEVDWIDAVFKAPSWWTERTIADPRSLKRAAPEILERPQVKAAKHFDHDGSVSDTSEDETLSSTPTADKNDPGRAAVATLESEHFTVSEQSHPNDSTADTNQEETASSSSMSDESTQRAASSTALNQDPAHVSEVSDGKDPTNETDPDQTDVATQTNEKSDLKRAAPTPLEQERTKAAKLDDQNGSTDQTDNDPIIVEQISDAEAISRLEKRLANANEAAKQWKKEREQLQIKCQEIKDGSDMWQLKYVELQEKVESGRAKIPASKGKSMSERLEMEIKQKYEKRIKDLKESHEEKFKNLRNQFQQKLDEKQKTYDKAKNKLQQKLDDREEDHKEALAELREKHTAQQKAKDDDFKRKSDELKKKTTKKVDDMKEKLSEAAEDHKETKQELRDKCKAAVHKYKPEHSDTVKKRDEEIKANLKKISDVEKSLEESKQEIKMLEVDLAEMTTQKEALESKLRDTEVQKQHSNYLLSNRDHEVMNLMRENSNIRQDLNTQLKDQEQEFKTRFKNRLAEEGTKWQVQYDRAEALQEYLTTSQRACGYLRDSLDGKLARIQHLEGCLRGAWARVDELTSTSAAANTNVALPDDSAIEGVRESIEDSTGVGNLGQMQAEM